MGNNGPEPTETDRCESDSKFIFIACNPASQQLCKKEIATSRQDLLPSFSRPGFLTYKLDGDLPPRFDLPLTFARSFGWSLEQIRSEPLENVAKRIRKIAFQQSASHIHIWQRDWADKDLPQDAVEPTEIPELAKMAACPESKYVINQVAEADQQILDVVRIDPEHWWAGWHVSGTIAQRWPGGIPDLPKPETMISRAYLKTCEALSWSGINIARHDVCAEIGSAPGGSCQRLLELGARVIAIDPADLDPRIATHKHLTHLKMRGRDVAHKNLSKVSWLLVDSNVAPVQTLDTVEALATSRHTRIRGLLLTLKFSKPAMVEELGSYVQRVRSWGYRFVKTRQLAYGRREVLLMALKQKSVRRFRG